MKLNYFMGYSIEIYNKKDFTIISKVFHADGGT